MHVRSEISEFGQVAITIRDSGPGIEPDNLNRVFEPFFTTKQVGEGTGLGLAVCYGIITDHGGRTSHAAIVSRELGLAAVVGCGNATKEIANDQEITVSCIESDEGVVYDGRLDFEEREVDVKQLLEPPAEIS